MASAAMTASNSPLEGPWLLCARPPASIRHPDQLDAVKAEWIPAMVPGTVAAALAAAGRWNIDQPLDGDAHDWWYRTTFSTQNSDPKVPCYLCFDGLATLAEVWLNGQQLLTSDNMFRSYCVDATLHLRPHNELVLVFRSLTHALREKRPRPRWKTNLVSHQQLRWHRTSLLGRIPGWSPPVAPVGPWRTICLVAGSIRLSDLRLATAIERVPHTQREEFFGLVTLQARLHSQVTVQQVTLTVGDHKIAAKCQEDAQGAFVQADLRMPAPPLWWPHTHGEPHCLDCSLEIVSDFERITIPCGKIGFRTIEKNHDGRFAVQVNGVPVYCRGACWTVSDIVTLDGTAESLTRDLRLARDAGINMLRVGGTMIYESDLFYRLCDELGIMVWQDFMFANMDYPVDDPDFAANIAAEATEQLDRLAKHPCVVVYCGNSEVEQQAAMLGIPQTLWRNSWFADRLLALCSAHHPGSAYVPSTPSGGALPFHVREGVVHYYGIGAYLRSPADLRKDDVAFASECLAFANIPEQATLDALAGGDIPAVHHPRWKERVPRDTGASWDFEDVRDFYLNFLFGVDPACLRRCDPTRYLQLSRVVPGMMMELTFAEWRSGHSRNAGAMIWFYKDLWPGAGWGILDSNGTPKAPYYALRRAWQTLQITITNEGLDGLHLHISNETAHEFRGIVELTMLKDQHIVTARREVACVVAARSRFTLSSDVLLQGFHDAAYAYRFGPPQHDVAIATLFDEERRVLSEAYDFPLRQEPVMLENVILQTTAERDEAGDFRVTLQTNRFLRNVSWDIVGFLPDDNDFHLSPLHPKIVRLTSPGNKVHKLTGYLSALNLKKSVRINLTEL